MKCNYNVITSKTGLAIDGLMQLYRQKLDAMKMPYEFRESEGGHTWTNWRVYLSEFVPKLFK